MTFTVAISPRACGHVHARFTRSDGLSFELLGTREDFCISDWQEAAKGMIWLAVKQLRAQGKTWAEVKSAIDGMEFSLP